MKLGSQKRGTVIGVFALFAFALLLFARTLWNSDSAPAAAAPKTVAPAAHPATTATAESSQRRSHIKQNDKKNPKGSAPATPTLDPRLKLGMLYATENTEYAGTGRNIFEDQEPVIPQPVKSAYVAPPEPATPPPPPPPPPINLKFFGFASKPGSPVRKAFLSNGDDVFVATEGDIVNRRYKILRINATSVEIQDVLSNNTQSIPLTQG